MEQTFVVAGTAKVTAECPAEALEIAEHSDLGWTLCGAVLEGSHVRNASILFVAAAFLAGVAVPAESIYDLLPI